MYRTNDPRFRRRLNEIGQTLESANESAQSGIYIFGQTYIKPCFQSIGACFGECIDASCPGLQNRNRDRLRRQRGRARSQGRAELNFDFYDDWDEDENDGLLGWGNDEFDRLLAGSGGYGTVAATQPARQRGMSYPKARRKSTHDASSDPNIIPGTGFFGKLFGGKALRYKPSAADLQEHPGARRLGRDITEGEALLEDSETSDVGGVWPRQTRNRSGTAGSRETQDSYSSRGDIFPSDEEDDAVPLDDEFAMVLERRATNMSGPDTDISSNKTGEGERKRGKRPSGVSRRSSRRTVSSKSARSKRTSRTSSHSASTPGEDVQLQDDADAHVIEVPTISELKQEDAKVAEEEEAEVERRRHEAQNLAAARGLALAATDKEDADRGEPPTTTQPPTKLTTDHEDDAPKAQTRSDDEIKPDDLPRHE